MKKLSVILILLLILTIGGLLRYKNLYIWPREGATFDEFAWSYLGISLLTEGVPVSWSPHPQYKDVTFYQNPDHTLFRLVRPYLEHPPFFGLIAGMSNMLFGVRDFDDVEIPTIRPLAFVLGIFSIAAVFFFAASFYGSTTGIISAGIYSIFPSIAIGSRILQNENFFIPLFLTSLGLAKLYVDKKNKTYLILVFILSFLLPLSKVPWISAPLASALYFFSHKKKKEGFGVIAMAALSITAFCFYGMAYGREVFFGLWKLQLNRYQLSFGSFFKIFQDPLLTDRSFLDGWVYMGWIVLFVVISANYKRHIGIIVGFLSYLLVFLFAIPSELGHGWYRYPFYPFFAVSFAVFLKEGIGKIPHIMCPVLTLLGLSLFEMVWVPVFGFSFVIHRMWLFLCACISLPVFIKGNWSKRIGIVATYATLVIISILSAFAILQYNEQ
ncbi:MAG: hypothetical protein UV63_C0001G0052 [Microgenomates group bacterium GW2011_GWC1_43_11]|uniref:Glycosyltransferase RgtA/B/C/D-like domain-containing protein n=2 Tax=Candidatus Gottesmaniibacteriota TaxID=1752720 RepID=A0A0G1LP04_9BACT|nr:MAG: hypothetical protein UV63_C0001G0052 [Microgenomates group bacterium GW2011_GWC1_43_11]KKT39141.1 MAG: hypothetical protein UW22_C0001G0052 [Candidatus Gottesmanbacteria bacterium GW2011_GWB1_44_11c]KKT61614.1 MAG: hypothetical protein UW52_C0001G0052 [Candidatus Gottesmanbacteria bacterium GW2011_GWA1_44_24b]HCM82189.1 hypothetical protein [Patescibacteria group bacterium]